MKILRHNFRDKPGSALLLTLFLVSGIMIVAFAGSYLIISGLRASGIQYDSSRAYFVAESGAEYSLMQVRKMGYDLKGSSYGTIFTGDMSDATFPGSFSVGYKTWAPIVLTSTGAYGATKRSVELNF
jgi:hypothetical protein